MQNPAVALLNFLSMFRISHKDLPWKVKAIHVNFDASISYFLFLFTPRFGNSLSLGRDAYSQKSTIFENLFFVVFVAFIVFNILISFSSISDCPNIFTMIIWSTSIYYISSDKIGFSWPLSDYIDALYLSLLNSKTLHLKMRPYPPNCINPRFWYFPYLPHKKEFWFFFGC